MLLPQDSNAIFILTVASPINLRGAATATEITLNWTDRSTIETGFEVQRLVAEAKDGNPEIWETIATTEANITTYTDTGRKAKTAYTYRVRAFYTDTTTTPATTTPSAWSNVVVVTTGEAPAGG